MVATAGRENHPEVVTSFEMCQPSHEVLVLHARLEGTTKTVKPFMETKLPEKLYQHRPQIAKIIFCVINVENTVTPAGSSRQFFWMFFLDAIVVRCHGHPAMAPPKLLVTLSPNHNTLQWHPVMWHHVHSPKVGRHPPLPPP